MCLFNVSPKARSPLPGTPSVFLSWDPNQSCRWGWKHSDPVVWILVPATVVPMTSLSHFLSHCLLVSEHRKLRSSGTKPASKHRSILHARFKTGRSRSRGTGKIQVSIQSTLMESLPPLLTPPSLLYWFIYTCVLLLHHEPE